MKIPKELKAERNRLTARMLPKPRVLTIERATVEGEALLLVFTEERERIMPLKPMQVTVLAEQLGDETDEWTGKRLRLARDEDNGGIAVTVEAD